MDKPVKKIVWFNSALNQSGGGERLSLETMRCFKQGGIDVAFVVYKYAEEMVFDGEYKNLKVVCMGDSVRGGTLSQLVWLRKVIREINPDRIITQGTWGQVLHAYLATLSTKYEYDVHVFGSMFAFPPALESAKYALIFKKNFEEVRRSQASYQDMVPRKLPPMGLAKRLKLEVWALVKYLAVRKAKNVYVLSRSNQWEVLKLYGRDSLVLKGAFPKAILDYTPRENVRSKLGLPDKKIILTISRLAVNKRIDLCIQSFYELCRNNPDVMLVIGGDGPERAKLKKLVTDRGLSSRVSFIGYVPDQCLWDYLCACDVFIHLDLADFDIAPLEALALGKKVVWSVEMETDPILINDKFIYSSQPDPVSVSKAIQRALNTDINTEDVRLYKIKLSDYTWESYAKKMLQHCKEKR